MKRNSNFLDFLLPAYHYKVVTYCGTTCTESTRTTEPLEKSGTASPGAYSGGYPFSISGDIRSVPS